MIRIFSIPLLLLVSACVSDPMNLKKWHHIDGSATNLEDVRTAYNDCDYGYYHRRFMRDTDADKFREWKDAEQCMEDRGYEFRYE